VKIFKTMTKKILLIFSFSFLVCNSFATTYIIGPSQTYTSPNALYLANVINNGDTIKIQNGVYSGTMALANWSKNNLVILGINGRPQMIAAGQNIGGKAIWIASGTNITIDNISFSGCSVPDQNGAGIRMEGNDMTIRRCYFYDNENGILTHNNYVGQLLIEYSEFNQNGFGDGQSHNIYVGHIQKLIFQYNYSHHAEVGHNMKSRANQNIILYNRIMDEAAGNSSRLIDLSNGGFSIIMGNLLMQGPLAVNNNMVGFGLEGLTNPSSALYFINNTMVNKRVASCRFLQIQSGTTIAQIVNNIFAGTGTLIDGVPSFMTNNYSNINISALSFVDEPNYNYNLKSDSPAKNGSFSLGTVNGYNLTPDISYIHPAAFNNRIQNGILDIGAYEYNVSCNSNYATYIFDGTYNDQWNNSDNWDNKCVPEPLYSGMIKIEANCIAKGALKWLFPSGGQLIIGTGKKLEWK
jgi:hypothetical protein